MRGLLAWYASANPMAAIQEFEVRVAKIATLNVGETRDFSYKQGKEARSGFVIRHSQGFSAFANFCPHWRVDLDMGEGKFYTAKVDRIFVAITERCFNRNLACAMRDLV